MLRVLRMRLDASGRLRLAMSAGSRDRSGRRLRDEVAGEDLKTGKTLVGSPGERLFGNDAEKIHTI